MGYALNSRRVKIANDNATMRTDTSTTPGSTYIGIAVIGSDEADAVWQIQRIDESSGMVTVLWADGNDSCDNIWDNRASLTYE